MGRRILFAEGMVTAPRRSPMSAADDRLALSVLHGPERRKGRKRRCSTCGLLFPPQDVLPEFNEDGRRAGWTCYGCE